MKLMENKIKYLAYLRKSTDSEDRQVNSIEDQKKEIEHLADYLKVEIKGVYQESKSAKKPGRPEFNRMLTDIKRGKANGILCWKINRLTRNPTDSGTLQQLLQDGVLKSIQTPGKEYKTGDNVLMMSVETGIANQFILDLSKDVKRGMLGKAEKGWRPGRAPLGYKNDKGADRGTKKIHVDEDTFPIVRKMWDLMLTGDYSVTKIVDIANNEWGLRTTFKKEKIKLGDRNGYVIFSNPFYYGEYTWNGNVYQGKHTPMVTPEEFERVQKLLGKTNRTYTRNKDLPYRRTIRCGECGCSITAEQKTKMIKSENILKTYIYHHCTNKKMDVDCSQKSTLFEEINRQILLELEKITIPKSFLDLSLSILSRENSLEVVNKDILIKNQREALSECQQRIDYLIKAFVAPNNASKEIMSDEEFKDQKSEYLKEKARIQQELTKLEQGTEEWLELTEKTFDFAVYAKQNFESGDFKTKSGILRALSSNCTLKDGKLDVTLRKQYQLIEKGLETIKAENPRLEPIDFALDKTKTASKETVFATWSG